MHGASAKRTRRLRLSLASGALPALVSWASNAAALEPWSDPDPPAPPTRITLTPEAHIGFRGAAEYRVNALSIAPPSSTGYRAGDSVDVEVLDWNAVTFER